MGDVIFKVPTTRHIIRMMAELMDLQADDAVCENCTASLIRIHAA